MIFFYSISCNFPCKDKVLLSNIPPVEIIFISVQAISLSITVDVVRSVISFVLFNNFTTSLTDVLASAIIVVLFSKTFSKVLPFCVFQLNL